MLVLLNSISHIWHCNNNYYFVNYFWASKKMIKSVLLKLVCKMYGKVFNKWYSTDCNLRDYLHSLYDFPQMVLRYSMQLALGSYWLCVESNEVFIQVFVAVQSGCTMWMPCAKSSQCCWRSMPPHMTTLLLHDLHKVHPICISTKTC